MKNTVEKQKNALICHKLDEIFRVINLGAQ